jgi:threonine dehydratase
VSDASSDVPDFAAVVAAADRLRGRIVKTPLRNSAVFDARVGRRVWFKCENLQRGAAFKIRGALDAVLQLTPEQQKIVTHSSGNHGAAVALAARDLGRSCVVVMPEDSAAPKFAAVAAAGARIERCAPGLAAREARLASLLAAEPAELVHPFDDARVIAGQGTAALEMLIAQPTLVALCAPVGGGGLIGGSAIAVRGLRGAACRVIGAEPAEADDAYRSWRQRERQPAGIPNTIADGLRGALGVRNFALVTQFVDDIVRVSERDIVRAMRIVLDDLKLLIEPSSAVAVAATLATAAQWPPGDAGVILTGGNVDLDLCPFLRQ